jgi:hypothetical protein
MQRKLKFDNDRLNAFTGLAKAIERKGGSEIFWGLPEDIFDHALPWVLTTIDSLKSRNRYFPSWSWASWPEAVAFPLYDRERLDETWKTAWVLEKGSLPVRRKHPYWKFYSDGRPEKITQKHTRYSMEREKREDIVTEDGIVRKVLHEERLFNGKKGMDIYLEETVM